MNQIIREIILSPEFLEASRKTAIGIAPRDHRKAMIDFLNESIRSLGIVLDKEDLILQRHFIEGDLQSDEIVMRIKRQLVGRGARKRPKKG